MIYQNIEIYNASKIIKDNGIVKWRRVPETVYNSMESEQGKLMCMNSTGVELRFVMKSDTVTLRMRTVDGA